MCIYIMDSDGMSNINPINTSLPILRATESTSRAWQNVVENLLAAACLAARLSSAGSICYHRRDGECIELMVVTLRVIMLI